MVIINKEIQEIMQDEIDENKCLITFQCSKQALQVLKQALLLYEMISNVLDKRENAETADYLYYKINNHKLEKH